MKLSKQAIVSANDLKVEFTDVPEWGGEVGLRVMSGAARDKFDAWMMQRVKPINPADDPTDPKTKRTMDTQGMRSFLLSLTLCDENGVLLFENDVATLDAKSAPVLNTLFDKAQQINGLTPAAVETAVKNSDGAPN